MDRTHIIYHTQCCHSLKLIDNWMKNYHHPSPEKLKICGFFPQLGYYIIDIGGVLVSLLDSSSAYNSRFEPRPGPTTVGICCFLAKHAALRRKSKDWLARNQDNVSGKGDMSIQRLLFQ